MFFSAQKNKCCSLDFHQDHNIYYRAKKLWLYGLTGLAWMGAQFGTASAQDFNINKENPNIKTDDIYLKLNMKSQNSSSPVNDLFSDELVEYSHYSHRSHSSHRSHYSHSSGSGYYYYSGDSNDNSGSNGGSSNKPSTQKM